MNRSELIRLLGVVAAWAAVFRLLSLYGVDLMPRSWAHQLTLEAYLALVQLTTLASGVALSFAVLKTPRRDLALDAPNAAGLAATVSLTPALFVLATGTAFQIARPTLLQELARGGAALVQKSSGEFGREMTQAPAALSFLWGAVLSPVSEELFFRGALFSLVLFALGGDRLKAGTVATVLVALVFGVLHHDMPGGMGIVRFVSALGLGLACGAARQLTASVVPPMLVHVLFNALSLATARKLFVFGAFPMKSGVPTLVAAVGLVGAWTVAVGYLLARRAR
jgi:membrane protease YdiL (CAAX protease family)